jgi:hypothetical protein
MQKNVTYRLTQFVLFTAMIFAIGFPANVHAESCPLFNEDFSGASGHVWRCGSHGTCTFNGKLELTQPESGYFSYGTTSFMPTGFFTLDADVALEPLSTIAVSPYIGIWTFTTGLKHFTIYGIETNGFAAMYYPGTSEMRFLIFDVTADEWKVTQKMAVTGPVTSIGMKFLSDKVVFRVNRTDTGNSLPGVFTTPEVIDSLWLMAAGSYSVASFDNVCASLNVGPTPSPSPPTPSPSPPTPSPSPPTPSPSPPPPTCEATINEDLLLHISYITYSNPITGSGLLWADFVYVPNPMVLYFKITNYGSTTSPPNPFWNCTTSTLINSKIHVPDVVLPKGNHLWMDLEFSPALSNDGNFYFVVTDFGEL